MRIGLRSSGYIYKPPDQKGGAEIFRNTHPPVWEGELADLIRTEIRRRSENIRGNSDPQHTHRFSGLGVCAECGSFLATFVNGKHRALICPASRSRLSPKFPDCDNRRVINERKIIARMDGYLRQMMEQNTTDIFTQESDPRKDSLARLNALSDEIVGLEDQARNLIRRQANAGEELQSLYDDELSQINTRLRNMRSTRTGLQSQTIEAQQTVTMQQASLEELAQITLEAFWNQESRAINQMLHRLMGKKRLLGLGGEIIGVAEVNRRQRRHV